MHETRLKRTLGHIAFAGLTLGAMTLAACGGSGGGGGTSSAGCTTPNGKTASIGSQMAATLGSQGLAAARPVAAAKVPSAGKNLVIATELPVVGTDASVGLPTQYGTDLAVSQNADLGGGYTLTVQHENYAGANGPDTGIATTSVQKLVSDPNVIAAVGPFNSGIAKVTIPISNNAGLVFISPANTNPGLTKEQYAAANSINFQTLHPAGKPNAYFRVPGTDDVQGKVDAQIASQTLGCKTAFVVDDNSVYGKGLADFFTTNFKANGGTTVGSRQSITAQQVSNLGSLADTIKNANPDVVFYGGITSGGGGALKKALVDKGFSHPMVGGDGIANDSSLLTTAGNDAAVGTWGTVAAPDLSALTSAAAAKFSTDYKAFVAGKPNNTLYNYSAMSYDCAMIEITAIKNVIASGQPVTRDAVRAEVQKANYAGITGQISFDQNGDNAGPKVFAVYAVDSSKNWVYKQQLNG
jgi:branched-chain amino acid transport system substrate-binding protein